MKEKLTGRKNGGSNVLPRQKWGLLVVAIALLTLGVIAPAILTVENFGVYRSIGKALAQWERIYVLVAAVQLVCLNTIRAIPHYLGAFFLAEAINDTNEKHWAPLSIMAVFLTIPAVYFLIEAIYGIRYDLGIPAASMIVTTLIFARIRFDFINITKKVLMMALMIIGLQFLDVMPLPMRLPIGRGESSLDIKLTAQFLGAEKFLQGLAGVCCVVFLCVGILLVILIHDENNIKRISEQKEQSERALMENQMRELENRTYKELNHLVHDLKSPLTSMQTLVGVVKLSCEDQHQEQSVLYLEMIESGIERMSSMISEILYEDRRTRTTPQKLLKGVLAQASATEYAEHIRVEDHAQDVHIAVNVIRFTRTLINLLENSFHAVDPRDGIIWLEVNRVTQEGVDWVCFEVRDNGSGMDADTMNQSLVNGFSTRGSSGLGLSFAENVVTQSGGHMDIHSVPGEGTQVKIFLPVCGEAAAEEEETAPMGQTE